MPSTIVDSLDGISTSVAVKAPCRVATTVNITLSGLQTIDGVSLAVGDRVLAKNQTNAIDNGIWIASNGTWDRAADFDGNRDVVKGTTVIVNDGTVNTRTGWSVSTSDPIVIGTTAITFIASPFIGSASELRADLASADSGKGDALVAVKRVLAGAIATNLHAWIEGISFVNIVTEFGADPTGVADSTAAIQAALTASLAVLVPPGTYKLTSTLTGRANQIIMGYTPEACQFVRSTVYGNTLTIGADLGGTHAGAVKISGIWFNHQYTFNNGSTYVAGTSTTITNKDPTAIHLDIHTGQNVRIDSCWFSGVGYGVKATDTTQTWFENCIWNGMWDVNVAGLQDTTANVWLAVTSSAARNAVVVFHGCALNGYAAAAATNVTTGSVTVAHTLNAGARYGLLVNSCERLVFSDGYIGGQSEHCVFINTTAITGHIHIHDNMIDGASNYSIRVACSDPTYPVSYLDIHDNTGVGYGNDQGFLWVQDNAGNIPVLRGDVHHNDVQYYLQTPFRIERGRGIKLSSNIGAAYNSDHSVTSDPYVMAGAVFDANSTGCASIDNTWGGGINDPSSSSFCKWGSYFYAVADNVASLDKKATGGFGIAGGTIVGGLAQTYPVLEDSTAIAPTFANAWVNLGGAYLAAGYYLDGFGIVHLQGTIQSGTIGLTAFILPAGYRPSSAILFAVNSNNAFGSVSIDSAGLVTPIIGNAAAVSLDGISFRPA